MIFTMWTHPLKGKLRLYVSPEAVAEFFPIGVDEATAFIGPNGWRYFSDEEAMAFCEVLRRMFASIAGSTKEEET